MKQVDKYTMYGTRLIILMEHEPQSNKYRQVILDSERFKEVSDAVCGGTVPEGLEEEEVEIIMSKDVYELPDLEEFTQPNNPKT